MHDNAQPEDGTSGDEFAGEDRIMDTEGLARYMGVKPRTVQDWRHENVGPDFFKLGGGRVRYRMSAVQSWMDRESTPGGQFHPPRPMARAARWRDFIAELRRNDELRIELIDALRGPGHPEPERRIEP